MAIVAQSVSSSSVRIDDRSGTLYLLTRAGMLLRIAAHLGDLAAAEAEIAAEIAATLGLATRRVTFRALGDGTPQELTIDWTY